MENGTIPTAKPLDTQNTEMPQQTSAGGRAVASFILGILSITCFGFLAGIPAIIVGKMEIKDIAEGKSPKSGHGLSKAGIILGIVGTVLTCIVTLASIAMVLTAVSLGKTHHLLPHFPSMGI